MLRLKNIGQPYVDYIDWRQVSTAMMAENYYRGNWNILYPETSWDGPGPSYQGREFQTISYAAAILYTLLGQHDWIGRSLAVAFGVWGVFALYCLICRVWDRNCALFGAAIMAVMPGSIFVERSFIPDPAMVALVTTTVWLFVLFLQTDKLKYLYLASIIGCWGFLTKITGMVVGIPMLYAMVHILGQRKQLVPKKIGTIFIAAIVTLVPVVAYYLWARYLSLNYPPYHFAGGGNWLWDYSLTEWIAQQYYLPKLYWNLNHWLWTEPIALLALMGIVLKPPYSGRTSEIKAALPIPKAPWLFHWWLLAGCLYYAIGAKELVINAWNLHALNPAVAAIVGCAIFRISQLLSRFRKEFVTFFLVCTLIVILGVGQRRLGTMYNPPWGNETNYQMGLALRAVSQPNDLVVTIPTWSTEPVAIYYSGRRGWSFPPHSVGWWGDEIADEPLAIQLFDELRSQGADWFAITSNRQEKIWQEAPQFANHIEDTCNLVQRTTKWNIYQIEPLTEHDPSLLPQ